MDVDTQTLENTPAGRKGYILEKLKSKAEFLLSAFNALDRFCRENKKSTWSRFCQIQGALNMRSMWGRIYLRSHIDGLLVLVCQTDGRDKGGASREIQGLLVPEVFGEISN